MDNEAIDVKWEVVTEEENPVTDANNQVLQGEVINAANTTVKSFDFGKYISKYRNHIPTDRCVDSFCVGHRYLRKLS